MSVVNYDAGWKTWTDMIELSPAPFHRRRMILKVAKRLKFRSILDVGCGNAALLNDFKKLGRLDLVGIDLSEFVINQNTRRFDDIRFYAIDISRTALNEKFDLVVCSEVLEHVEDFDAALRNLHRMCSQYLIVTVPAGRVFPIDQRMGHVRHFSANDIRSFLKIHGFKVLMLVEWGFPFHTLYKYLINLKPNACLDRFGESEYGRFEKWISRMLCSLFYLNLNVAGLQICCLAEVEGR